MQNATNARAISLARKLAAIVNPANNASETERATALAKLIAHCEKHGLNLADYVAPDATAKPEKPSKPDAASPNAADATEREKLIAELRASVARLYNGPSLAVRTNAKRFAVSAYAELLTAPKHRTTLAKLSIRDESALAEIIKRGTKAGAFCPSTINLDCGIFSRLCSVGFIVATGDNAAPFALTDSGIAHARKAAKRAA